MALLLERQQIFDKEKFDRYVWGPGHWRDQKTAYVGTRIGTAIGELFEGDRRQIIAQTIPDLRICQAQLVLLHDLREDVCDDVTDRVPGPNDAIRRATLGRISLDRYLEPLDHGIYPTDEWREATILPAVANLHVATESLGSFYGVDVEAAHQLRLEQLMGEDAHLLGQV